MKNLMLLFVAALSFVISPYVAFANTPISIPYEKYVLPSNGLEIILSEDHSLPIVAVNVWYHAGPINEPPSRTGFAHLFEHLMFQGSKHVGDDMHFKLLEASGASLINGTTDYDRTNYFETVPSNQLEMVLWLESDRMGFLRDTLTQEKLDNQREVVMNERRQSVDNVPYGPSNEKLIQALFPPEHPYYGNVIGSMEHLTAATLDDVRTFYDAYYAPSNATLVVAGDFDVKKTKTWIDTYFATLSKRDKPAVPQVTTPNISAEKRVSVPEAVSAAQVNISWLTPAAYQTGDADCDILAMILGIGKSSRLYKNLVYTKELAQQVSVHQESLALRSTFTITATARPGVSAEKLERAIEAELVLLQKNPPTALEITRARNMLLTTMLESLENIGGFGGKADMLNRYNQYVGNPGYLNDDLARYQKVTQETLKQTAQTYLRKDARVVVTTVPQS